METVRDARIRTAFLVSRQPSVVECTPRTMPRLAGADSSSIAFDDGQFRGAGRTHRQGLVCLGVSVATLGQFGTDIVHYPLDRLGGNPLIAYLFFMTIAARSDERACLSGGDSDPLHQERRSALERQSPALPEGGKKPRRHLGQ